ncbi:MAG: hypothetical protein HY563_05710 [Ignavibacteriales bacterium]|nr:hypothetical protein [Ignavibacteriales bacterium]
MNPPIPKQDPLGRYIPLGIKIAVYLLLVIYLIQAADVFYEYVPGQPWPFLLRAIRNGIFVFIHEGGHARFFFFGRTMTILGGSFWQIAFPLLSFIIALRKSSHFIAPFALFWVGTNMMDVSLYMRDAPVRRLPLLAGHKVGHDWWNLFREWNMLESAGTWADVFYFVGILIGIGAIGWGIYLSIERFLNPLPFTLQADDDEAHVPRPMFKKPNSTPSPPRPNHSPPERGKSDSADNTFDGLI